MKTVKALKATVTKDAAYKCLLSVMEKNDAASSVYRDKIKKFNPENIKLIWVPCVESTYIFTRITWQSYDYYDYKNGYTAKIEGDYVTVKPNYESGHDFKWHSTDDYDFKHLLPFEHKKMVMDERVSKSSQNYRKEWIDITIDVDEYLTQSIIKKSHSMPTKDIARNMLQSKKISVHEMGGVTGFFKDYIYYYPIYQLTIDNNSSYVDAITGEYTVLDFAKSEDYYEYERLAKRNDGILFLVNVLIGLPAFVICAYITVSTYMLLLESDRNPSFIFNIIFIIPLLIVGFLGIYFCLAPIVTQYKAKSKAYYTAIKSGIGALEASFEADITGEDFYHLIFCFLGGIVIPIVYTLLVAVTTLAGKFSDVFIAVFTFHNPLIYAIFG